MGLFKKKYYDKGLMMYAFIFEDVNPEYAEAYRNNPYGMGDAVIYEYQSILLVKYFAGEITPRTTIKSYLSGAMKAKLKPEEKSLQFWSDETGEIIDQGGYVMACQDIFCTWEERLYEEFPDYSRKKIKEGLDRIHFDYIPEKGMILACIMLDKILPLE